jgi:hypothetical protein
LEALKYKLYSIRIYTVLLKYLIGEFEVMKKRAKKEIIEKAAPDLFGKKVSEVQDNYVSFPVPAWVYEKVKAWIKNEEQLEIYKDGQDKDLRLCIINRREQNLNNAAFKALKKK